LASAEPPAGRRRRIRGKSSDPNLQVKHPVTLIAKSLQLKYRHGCSKCRNAPFCTISCYKYRKQRVAEDVD
jgi:radical SAM protein with 4Fe4S-binding SPASM domain